MSSVAILTDYWAWGGGCGNPWQVLREPLTYSQSEVWVAQTSHWILKWEQSYETEPFNYGVYISSRYCPNWVELMAIKIVSKS